MPQRIPLQTVVDCARRVLHLHFRAASLIDPALSQEDLEQEAILIGLQNRRRWDARKAPAAKFLHGIMRLRLIDRLRVTPDFRTAGKVSTLRGSSLPALLEERSSDGDPTLGAQMEEKLVDLRPRVAAALEGIPNAARRVLRDLVRRRLSAGPSGVAFMARRWGVTPSMVRFWIVTYGGSIEEAISQALGEPESMRLFYERRAEPKRNGTMPGDVKSKAQAGLMGAICAGKKPSKTVHISKEAACRMVRGADVKRLPARKGKK